MPTFDTPEPIVATIGLSAGSLRITAGDRTDTVVEVRPSSESDDADVKAAERTQVEYANGKLSVKVPRTRGRWWLFSGDGSVRVAVELPAGSRIDTSAGMADIQSTGRLGGCRITASYGDVQLDETGVLEVDSNGTVSVTRTVGHAGVTTTNGDIRIREIDGEAVVKTTSGGISLVEATGDLQLNTAYGDISVDRALAGVRARTAYGSVRIGEVMRGSVALETSYGALEVGIRKGTAAWLDIQTRYGKVRNSLDPADGPASSDETVEVRARTTYGDVVIRRP